MGRELDVWSGQGKGLLNIQTLLDNGRRRRTDLLDSVIFYSQKPQPGNGRASVWWDMQEYCAWRLAIDHLYGGVKGHAPHAVFVGLQKPDFWPGLPVPARLTPLLNAPVVIASGPNQARAVEGILGREVMAVRHPVNLEDFSPSRKRGATILAVANWPGYYGLDRLDATGLDIRYVGKFLDGRGSVETEMPSVYRDAAVFVRVTRQEGNCLSRAESLACGIPQVASEAGDAREQVRGNGIVLTQEECDDPERLRAAILSVAEASDDVWRAMSHISRLVAQELHHPKAVAAEWRAVIRMLEEL